MYGKLPTLPKSLFFCSVSSLSATLSFGLWASFRLTTIIFRFCTRPIADVRLNQLPFFVSFVLFVVNSLRPPVLLCNRHLPRANRNQKSLPTPACSTCLPPGRGRRNGKEPLIKGKQCFALV